MSLNAMTPKHWLLAIVVIILFAGAGGYWLANYRSHDTPAAAASGERKVLYWHDPMVPNVRFEKPGKSPFMDMHGVHIAGRIAIIEGQDRPACIAEVMSIQYA